MKQTEKRRKKVLTDEKYDAKMLVESERGNAYRVEYRVDNRV